MTQEKPWVPAGLDAPPNIRTIPFTDLRCASTTPEFQAADRLDPYWHGMWSDGAQASWMSKALLNRLAAAKLAKVSRHEARATTKSALAAMLWTRRDAHLRELAAIGMWRTVTGQQLAALTGHRAAAVNAHELNPAFRAGLIDRGSLLTDLRGGGEVPQAHHLYRPVDSPAFDDLLGAVTFEEKCSVTAGQPWNRGAQNDRHNLLATELGLRVAEFCDIGTVLGEKLSRVGMLSRNDPAPTGPAADFTIVREDAHRIGVELTASSTPAFAAKVRRWAKAIAETDRDQIGLSVLFIEAAGPERPDFTSTHIWKNMRTEIAAAAYENGGARLGVPERMAIARWRWFFPEPGATSTAFRILECLAPTGPWNDRWRTVSLLDPTDLAFDPVNPDRANTLLTSSFDVGGLPHWLQPAGHKIDFSEAQIILGGLQDFPRMERSR